MEVYQVFHNATFTTNPCTNPIHYAINVLNPNRPIEIDKSPGQICLSLARVTASLASPCLASSLFFSLAP